MELIRRRWFAILVPALIGLGMAAWGIRVFEQYGYAIFIGLPLLVSFCSSFCTSFRRRAAFGITYWTSVASLLALGAFILVFALDGLLCLLMALPLAMIWAVLGTFLGRLAGSALGGKTGSMIWLLLVAVFPALVAFEGQGAIEAPVRKVVSSVTIDASLDRVWEMVLAFPRITTPPAGIFRLGIAYPVEARIEGTGPGALRYCTFSTGSFVEPVTRWEAPRLLAFDVTASPPPLQEFSLYGHVDPAHLHGHMKSLRGQFRLFEKEGKVVLEGSTWYQHGIAPQWYWGPVSDQIIHAIHHRVLEHIKHETENPGGRRPIALQRSADREETGGLPQKLAR